MTSEDTPRSSQGEIPTDPQTQPSSKNQDNSDIKIGDSSEDDHQYTTEDHPHPPKSNQTGAVALQKSEISLRAQLSFGLRFLQSSSPLRQLSPLGFGIKRTRRFITLLKRPVKPTN